MPRVRGRQDWNSLTEGERESYARALDALSIARLDQLPAREAARQAHTSVENIERWAPDSLTRDSAGRLVIAGADRLFRPITVIQRGGGPVEVATRGSGVASKASAYARTVDAYRAGLVGGHAFEPFEGMRIGGVEVEADPDRIDELENSGALDDWDSLYADPTA
jgi:hypothetical protein